MPLVAQPALESRSKLRRISGVIGDTSESRLWLNWVVPPSCSVPCLGIGGSFLFHGMRPPRQGVSAEAAALRRRSPACRTLLTGKYVNLKGKGELLWQRTKS